MSRKTSYACCLAAGLFTLSGGAVASDFSIIPRASLGAENYSLKWKGNLGSESSNVLDIQDTMPALALGGTLAFRSFYLDAYYQQSGDGSDDNVFDRERSGTTTRYTSDLEFDRSDYALALGYSFDMGLALFGGYKGGETNIDGTQLLADADTGVANDVRGQNSYKFKADGPFVGAAYGLPIGNGLLSFSLAWAWLSGDATVNYHYVHSDGTLDHDSAYDSSPDASGLSLSLKWRAPITERLSYSLGLEAQRYEFDEETMTGTQVDADGNRTDAESIPLTIEEQVVTLKADISYRF